jgi:hypothetical protein
LWQEIPTLSINNLQSFVRKLQPNLIDEIDSPFLTPDFKPLFCAQVNGFKGGKYLEVGRDGIFRARVGLGFQFSSSGFSNKKYWLET